MQSAIVFAQLDILIEAHVVVIPGKEIMVDVKAVAEGKLMNKNLY